MTTPQKQQRVIKLDGGVNGCLLVLLLAFGAWVIIGVWGQWESEAAAKRRAYVTKLEKIVRLSSTLPNRSQTKVELHAAVVGTLSIRHNGMTKALADRDFIRFFGNSPQRMKQLKELGFDKIVYRNSTQSWSFKVE